MGRVPPVGNRTQRLIKQPVGISEHKIYWQIRAAALTEQEPAEEQSAPADFQQGVALVKSKSLSLGFLYTF